VLLTDEGECDAEPAVAAASDDEQLRSLRELLVDATSYGEMLAPPRKRA
jgi:hypothetical protein